MKFFSQGELNHFNRIFEHIRRGGIAVLSGEWDKILELSGYVERKKAELVFPRQSERQRKSGKQKERRKGLGRKSQTNLGKLSLPGMLRLMAVADESGYLDVEPPLQIPYLLELVGDTVGSNAGRPFLIPISVVQKIQAALSNAYAVPLFGEDIVTSRNVFQPNSSETIALFFEGLRRIKNVAPSTLDALDMGCGSGCLALLAAQVFEDRNITIVATDHLPEALATTKINIQRFLRANKILPDMIEVTQGGDLFEPIPDRRFDVIIFNAPWVVAPARNRAETAIHDQNQNTVRRFFSQAREHLKDEGYILLGYSDNSGQKAIEKLEDIIQNTGFQIVNLLKERVQTRRAKRRWETIFVYTCVKHAFS